jgi:hypothetical protein
MFVAYDMAKPDTENIRGLNLAAVNLTTVQVTKLPLYHKLNKIAIICLAKPDWWKTCIYCKTKTLLVSF